MSEERSWPTTDMFRTLYQANLVQLESMLAYLPKEETEAQREFIQLIQEEIEKHKNTA